MCHCVAIQVYLLCLGLNCKIIFRYLLNYILLTYYLLWSNERVCTQIAHSLDNRPIFPTLCHWQMSCRHLSARSGNPAFSRQHTNSMCVDIGTQYPHKHNATFTLFPKSNILDSIKIAIFSRRLVDSRRGLIDASHLGSHAGLSKN